MIPSFLCIHSIHGIMEAVELHLEQQLRARSFKFLINLAMGME
jgi:hypothetical protein